MQLTKMSISSISWNGPPLAVSSRSHLRISSLFSKLSLTQLHRNHEDPLVQSNLTEEVYCSSSTPAECANDQRLYTLPIASQLFFDIIDHGGFIWVWIQPFQFSPILLRSQGQSTRCSTCKASMESKGGDSPSLIILEKL